MYHGKSKIIRKSIIDPDLIDIFLDEASKNDKYTNYFQKDKPETKVHEAILELLRRECFGCSRNYIEYWFQDRKENESHWPHVDFNEFSRAKLADGKKVLPEELMSPITIACYLEINNMIGGEFCISERSWQDYESEIQPEDARLKDLLQYTYETYKPVTGDVLYFEGSRYYHWIQKLHSGSRKSMLINFWNEV